MYSVTFPMSNPRSHTLHTLPPRRGADMSVFPITIRSHPERRHSSASQCLLRHQSIPPQLQPPYAVFFLGSPFALLS